MKYKLLSVSLAFALLNAPVYAFTHEPLPDALKSSLMQKNILPWQALEKNFNFDWNNYATISPNKIKIAKIEAQLASLSDANKLSVVEQQSLGKLLYKLGTFYTHVSREPDLAIAKMTQADPFLNDRQTKAWNDNHLAYAYELKFAASNAAADKDMAFAYANQVIEKLYPEQTNKEVAFAYCVKGLIYNDAKDYIQAEANFKKALHMYETMPQGKDDQYARAKNRLADIILDQNNRNQEAFTMLKELKSYWLAKKNVVVDPYAARNFISLGKAYLKMGHPQAARNEFNYAIRIYKNVYGMRSVMLAKPYQLLAESYKKSGNLKQAKAYENKSIQLAKR